MRSFGFVKEMNRARAILTFHHHTFRQLAVFLFLSTAQLKSVDSDNSVIFIGILVMCVDGRDRWKPKITNCKVRLKSEYRSAPVGRLSSLETRFPQTSL